MIHTTENFLNKVATEINKIYFPNLKWYRDDDNCVKAHYDLELFSNGCLTYRQLIGRLAKSCKDTTSNIHKIVEKYVEIWGEPEE